MGRNLDDVVAALPKARRARVQARAQELKQQVESLSELRRLAGKAQVEIASALNDKQPSVSKIEKQADMYLSTLRNYVEAVGGQLDLIVRLPSRAPLRIERLGDVALGAADKSGKITTKRQAKPKTAALVGSRK